MNYVAFFDPTGRIVDVDCSAQDLAKGNPWAIKISAAQYKTVKGTHHVNLKSKKLVKGVVANPNQVGWAEIRSQRDCLLVGSGQKLTEYMLPDSFPTMTPAQKQAKIDALLAYRQALRDITKQKDPNNIIWPTPPA